MPSFDNSRPKVVLQRNWEPRMLPSLSLRGVLRQRAEFDERVSEKMLEELLG